MKKAMVTLVAALIGILTVAAPASAGTRVATDAFADWGDNKACAVMGPGDIRCFPTEADMERKTERAPGTVGDALALLAGYCQGRSDLWIYLYEHTGFGGRVLKFRDPGYWQTLSTWGFNNQTSSWRNDTGCAVWAADGDSGSGTWLTMSAHSSSSSMGAWDERVSSIFITS